MLLASCKDLNCVAQETISIINLLIPVLVTLALILFFVGLIRYLAKSGDEKGKQRDKEVILWGLIALFIIFSVWGILGILKRTFLSGTGGDPWQGLRESDIDPWRGLR